MTKTQHDRNNLVIQDSPECGGMKFHTYMDVDILCVECEYSAHARDDVHARVLFDKHLCKGSSNV